MNNLIFSNKRLRCPECGARRGFAPIQGNPNAGKCHACGMFIAPENGNYSDLKPIENKRINEPVKRKAISEFQVMASQADLEDNNFVHGLLNLNIPLYHLERWNIGNGENNSTLFFYQDINGKYTNAKIIVYKHDLHRDKTIQPRFMFTKQDGYNTCLFGEWQLKDLPKHAPVLLVESEKTAIIASYAMPNKTWIATGGASALTREKAKILSGYRIYIVFDSDQAGRQNAEATKQLLDNMKISAKIIDLFQDKDAGQDIADYLIQRFQEIRIKVNALPIEQREQFEERSAIMEYCAGLSRYEAELQTLNSMNSLESV